MNIFKFCVAYTRHTQMRLFTFLPILVWILLTSSFGVSVSDAATIDVTDSTYGAVGNGIVDDTAAIKSAVAALNDYDVLLFPEAISVYKVDIDADFAIDNVGVRVIVRGHIQGAGTPVLDKHIFKVTAADCEFVGEGGQAIIEGSGLFFNDVPTDDGPSLIRVFGSLAKNCHIQNITFRHPPFFGISVRGADGARVRNCRIEGGPTSLGVDDVWNKTGIFYRGANLLTIRDCVFRPSVSGGRMRQWISSSSSSSSYRVLIHGNKFESSWDHAMYIYGTFSSVISENIIYNSAGSAIKMRGTHNLVCRNVIYQANAGGIEMRNPVQCIVSDNVIYNCNFVGIQLFVFGGNTSDYLDNQILGNTIHAATSGTVYEGIRVLGNGSGSVTRTSIIGNNLRGMGQTSGLPAILLSGNGVASFGCVVMGNIVEGAGNNGVELDYINRSIVSKNYVWVSFGKTAIKSSHVTEANVQADTLKRPGT